MRRWGRNGNRAAVIGITAPAQSFAQLSLNLLARVALALHRTFDVCRGRAGLLRFVAHFVLLTAGDAGAVLRAAAAGLLVRTWHRVLRMWFCLPSRFDHSAS